MPEFTYKVLDPDLLAEIKASEEIPLQSISIFTVKVWEAFTLGEEAIKPMILISKF